MKPMLTAGRVSLMLLSLVVLAPSAVMGADETFRLSAPRYWLDNWAIPSGISLAGDADGDGRAELVAVDPRGNDRGRKNLASGQVGRGSRAANPIR